MRFPEKGYLKGMNDSESDRTGHPDFPMCLSQGCTGLHELTQTERKKEKENIV